MILWWSGASVVGCPRNVREMLCQNGCGKVLGLVQVLVLVLVLVLVMVMVMSF